MLHLRPLPTGTAVIPVGVERTLHVLLPRVGVWVSFVELRTALNISKENLNKDLHAARRYVGKLGFKLATQNKHCRLERKK